MFSKFFIDRPIFAWVIALIILLGGALALRGLPVAQYPSVAPPALAVTTTSVDDVTEAVPIVKYDQV